MQALIQGEMPRPHRGCWQHGRRRRGHRRRATERRRERRVVSHLARRAPAIGLVVTRSGEALAVLVLLASLVFFALRLLPGDPAALVLGNRASPRELALLRNRLHLDEPMAKQYGRFLWGLPRLDFGESLRRPECGPPAA